MLMHVPHLMVHNNENIYHTQGEPGSLLAPLYYFLENVFLLFIYLACWKLHLNLCCSIVMAKLSKLNEVTHNTHFIMFDLMYK